MRADGNTGQDEHTLMVGKLSSCIVMIQGCVGAVILETKLHNINQVKPWRSQLIRQALVSQALLISYMKKKGKKSAITCTTFVQRGGKNTRQFVLITVSWTKVSDYGIKMLEKGLER